MIPFINSNQIWNFIIVIMSCVYPKYERNKTNKNSPLLNTWVKSIWSIYFNLLNICWYPIRVFLSGNWKCVWKTVGPTPCCFHSLASVNIKQEIKRTERQDGDIRRFASQSVSAYSVAVKQRHVITKWTSWHGVPENVMQICQIVHFHIHEYGKENEFTVSEIIEWVK